MTKQNIKLKYARVFEKDGRCYLKLVYGYEDDSGIHEFVITKLDLGISSIKLPEIRNKTKTLYPEMSFTETFAVFGNEEFCLRAADVEYVDCGEIVHSKNVYYVDTMVEEKVHKMTLSEIEKKLGYKIELVGEKQ